MFVFAKGPSPAVMSALFPLPLIAFLLGRPVVIIADDGFLFFAEKICTGRGFSALYMRQRLPYEQGSISAVVAGRLNAFPSSSSPILFKRPQVSALLCRSLTTSSESKAETERRAEEVE